jgi:predicted PurR-regulated permease PerM
LGAEDVPHPPGEDGVFLFIRSTVTGEGMKQALFAVTRYGVTWFWQAVLILFIILFLLLEGEVLARRVRDIFGTQSETRHQVTQALLEMGQSVRTYLVWRTIINFALAVFLGAIYHSLGLRQAWTWALLTAILSYVPYLGTIAAGVPPLLDAFLNVSPVAAFFILCLYIAVVTFEGYIIVPWVMGRSMDMNATTVILSCLFWDLVWGTPGLFLAMPLMAAIKAVCNHVETWKPWARLMSTADWRETEAEAEKKLVAEERVRQIAQQVGTNGLADEPTVVMEGLDDRPPPGKSPV